MRPDFSVEQSYISQNLIVCGVDEAGRGPWAGPVVAAAVILDPANIPAGLNDSKKLSPERRDLLFDKLNATAVTATGIISAQMIDEINILQATFQAMQDAVAALKKAPHVALIDGNRAPKLSCRTQTIIDGDALTLSIAAASIIAKVTRDRLMSELDLLHPHFGFAAHKGYGTVAHQLALAKHGPCPEHRKSFKPIRALLGC